MNFEKIFGKAEWIGAPEGTGFATVRDYFEAREGEKAEITLLGFGRFVLYVNGTRAHDELFLPLNSFFENKESYGALKGRVLGTRAYPCKFDISHLVRKGKNSITVMLGGGWYVGSDVYAGRSQGRFGLPKLCYRITADGEEFFSSTSAKYSVYFVKRSLYNVGEEYDFSDCGMEIADEHYDDSKWASCVPAEPLECDRYELSDCPCDKVISEIEPVPNGQGVYDAGLNLTGYPVLVSRGGDVAVSFSEELAPDGTLDEAHSHRQFLIYKNTKAGQRLEPLFTWIGFRYFKIEGDADAECVKKVHADVRVTSSFDSDNETLNWIYKTFVHTMLSNMHEGQPSDCPHIERRGYTGDGQVTAPAVFRTLGAKEFYKKWIVDIADSQDRKTGMVQNTAPFTNSGGGPGGWGGAIIIVPYEYWKYYGDETPARLVFREMMGYLDFMERLCEGGLVGSNLPYSGWCLGEWCLPYLKAELPPAFVNTYFYIKTLQMGRELSEAFGHTEYVAIIDERIAVHTKAFLNAYFNDFPRHGCQFLGGTQGADAFALDIGLGNESTVQSFIERYEKLDTFDTGIFGTEIVTRLLFKYGRGDIAVKLLCAEEPYGFGAWKKQGATTFWEYWLKPSRSLSHPMFGAVVASFFDGLLGIRQKEGSFGYSSVVVKPADVKGLDRLSGSITTPRGVISVSYTRREDGTLDVRADAPQGIKITVEA